MGKSRLPFGAFHAALASLRRPRPRLRGLFLGGSGELEISRGISTAKGILVGVMVSRVIGTLKGILIGVIATISL